jgi:hypothetical protein
MLGLTLDQLGFAAAGFLGVIVIALSWALSKRAAYEKGYGEGQHDREHWETDKIVKGKLERA